MTRTFPLLLIAVLAICTPSLAQVCDSRSGAPVQMQIQLTFSDQAPEEAPGAVSTQNDPMHRGDIAGGERSRGFTTNMQIHVQLQDPLGGTLQESAPSPEGLVRMTVCKNGIYRLRVTGSTIEEAVLDDLHPSRGDKLVTVVLHHKLNKQGRKEQKATISLLHLQVPRKARKLFDKGNSALKKGKLEDAEKYYVKATEIYPQYEEAENSLGIVLMQEGKKAEGKAAFSRAVAMNAHFASACVNLAKIAMDEKQFSDAYSLAKQAIASEPLNPGALFLGAESAFFTGQYTETVSYTRTLHSLPHQQYSLAHFLAAKSLEVGNQPDAAIHEYQTFLDEDPLDPNAQRARELLSLLQLSQAAASANRYPH